MGRKNIYVSDEDEPIWRRAEELSGLPLSRLVSTLLRQEVARMENERTGGGPSATVDAGGGSLPIVRFGDQPQAVHGSGVAIAYLVGTVLRAPEALSLLQDARVLVASGTMWSDDVEALAGRTVELGANLEGTIGHDGDRIVHVREVQVVREAAPDEVRSLHAALMARQLEAIQRRGPRTEVGHLDALAKEAEAIQRYLIQAAHKELRMDQALQAYKADLDRLEDAVADASRVALDQDTPFAGRDHLPELARRPAQEPAWHTPFHDLPEQDQDQYGD